MIQNSNPGIGAFAREVFRLRAEEARAKDDVETELQRCKDRFAYFLFEVCRTQDEHDSTVFAKPFPRLDYIREIADVLQTHRRIAVEKSRQMMISWIACAFVLWVAMFHPNVLAFVQSKKEEDAADRLDRIYKIYFRLPEWLRERFPINLNSGRPGNPLYTHIYFTWRDEDRDFFDLPETGEGTKFSDLVASNGVRSHIWAIPQGADVVRQYTGTLIFSDEDAFQEEAGEAYGAIMPTLGRDSWYLKVSTANPGHFQTIVQDREDR